MRQFINALDPLNEVLLEGDFLNTRGDAITVYLKEFDYELSIPDAKRVIADFCHFYTCPAPVTQWFTTVFYKWAVRDEVDWRGHCPMAWKTDRQRWVEWCADTECDISGKSRETQDRLVVALCGALAAYPGEEVLFPMDFFSAVEDFGDENPAGFDIIELRDYLMHLSQEGQTFERMSVEDAFLAAERWHAAMDNAKEEKSLPPIEAGEEGVDYKVIMNCGNDMTMIELLSAKECQYEGRLMKHCVAGYSNMIGGGHMRLFSLRDQQNKPWVTLDVRKIEYLQLMNTPNPNPTPAKWVAFQIKGNCNQAVKPELRPCVDAFLEAQNIGANQEYWKKYGRL